MSCCGIGKGCGRIGLDEPGPGLEPWEGKYACTLCIVNPTKFAQPRFKKGRSGEQAQKLAEPAKKGQLTDADLFKQDD